MAKFTALILTGIFLAMSDQVMAKRCICTTTNTEFASTRTTLISSTSKSTFAKPASTSTISTTTIIASKNSSITTSSTKPTTLSTLTTTKKTQPITENPKNTKSTTSLTTLTSTASETSSFPKSSTKPTTSTTQSPTETTQLMGEKTANTESTNSSTTLNSTASETSSFPKSSSKPTTSTTQSPAETTQHMGEKTSYTESTTLSTTSNSTASETSSFPKSSTKPTTSTTQSPAETTQFMDKKTAYTESTTSSITLTGTASETSFFPKSSTKPTTLITPPPAETTQPFGERTSYTESTTSSTTSNSTAADTSSITNSSTKPTTFTTPSNTETTQPSAEHGQRRRLLTLLEDDNNDDNTVQGVMVHGSCVCKSTPVPNNVSSTKEGRVTTTAVPSKYTTVLPALGNKKVELNFEIEVGDSASFKKELLDHNSPTFNNYSKAFKDKLTSFFKDTPGYKDIEVYGFRNGSIIALYRLVLASYNDVKNATNHIKTNVLTAMEKSLTTIHHLTVNKEFLKKDFVQRIENITKSGCEAGVKALCYDMCVKNDKPLCGEHGSCYIDFRNYKAKCSCLKIDDNVYHGEHCESSAEALKLSSIYIIAIAAGCGGALLIVVTVLIICLIRARRKRVRSHIGDKDTHFKSVSMDDIRLDQLDGKRPRQKTVLNDYQTGLPGQDIIYVQGREHRVHTDAKGDESYIYQPKSLAGSDLSTISQRPSVYDYIDTDSRFEIQRPYVHLGHLNKY